MSNYNRVKYDIQLIYPEYSNIATGNYIVDIKEIVKQKHKIPMQYEDINIGGNPDDLHRLSKKVDRYLLHIIEEIAEFKEEIDRINFYDCENRLYVDKHYSCLMELIDIIAYISSIISLFFIDMYGLDAVSKGQLPNPDTYKFYIYYCKIEKKYDSSSEIINCVNSELLEVEKNLMLNLRRQFPERKWHKDVNRTLSINDLGILYKTCISHTSNALVELISMFLYLTGDDYELFNKLFLEKNETVYNLKNKN